MIIKDDPSIPVISLIMRIKAGSINEDSDSRGISALVEHSLFSETPSIPDVGLALERIGCSFYSYTTRDFNSFNFECLSSHAEDLIQLIEDVIANSELNESLLNEAKAELFSETRSAGIEQSFRSMLLKKFLELTFTRHPYRYLAEGDKIDYDAITLDDAITYYKSLYIPENITIAIVGQFNKRRIKSLLKNGLGTLERAPPKNYTWDQEPVQRAPRDLIASYPNQKPLALVSVGWKAPSVTNPDTYAMDVFLAAIGIGESCRLNRHIRDRFMQVYFTEAEYITPMEPGYIMITALCGPAIAEEVKEAILDEVDIISRDSITPDELIRAKRHYETMEAYNHQNRHKAAVSYCFWSLMKDLDLAYKYLPNIQNVTLDDIQSIAARYLKRTNYNSVILMPEKPQ